MKLKISLPLLLICLLGLTVACQRKAATVTTDMSADKVREELSEGTWTLNTINGAAPGMGSGQQMPSLTFAADGKVSGFTGCNPLQGSYMLEDGLRLKFDNVAVALSMCPEAQTEKAFLEAINTTDNFTLNDGILSLNVGRRAPLATLTRQAEQVRRK